MICCARSVDVEYSTNSGNSVLDHADRTSPTPQHELDHKDLPEVSGPSSDLFGDVSVRGVNDWQCTNNIINKIVGMPFLFLNMFFYT